MKKQILNFGFIAALAGVIAVGPGCSSKKKTSSSDTTIVKDTTKVVTPNPAPDTTIKKDTLKKDTTHN